MPGVIGHVPNPTMEQAANLAMAAEDAGGGWIGLADAFWWRDVWILLAAAARNTSRIELGPAMTNPYLRHRYQTASALATLQELAPGRVFCGVAAGGSELTAAAAVSRTDAPLRVRELVTFLREVAASQILDAGSGRTLEVTLGEVPILVAGRGEGMLRTAGAVADRVLLWAIPASDLDRSVALIRAGSEGRATPPELIWAPLLGHDDAPESSIMHVAVYASLNTAAGVRAAWGLTDDVVDAMRAELVAGDLAAAVDLVPQAALADLVIDPADPRALADLAGSLGVASLAVPGFGPDTVGGHVRWAQRVEEHL